MAASKSRLLLRLAATYAASTYSGINASSLPARTMETYFDQLTTPVSLILLCVFLRVAWESGASARRTIIWLRVLVLNATLLLMRAFHVGPAHPHYRRLMLLWAADVLICFAAWLWSFQPSEAERSAADEQLPTVPDAPGSTDTKASK